MQRPTSCRSRARALWAGRRSSHLASGCRPPGGRGDADGLDADVPGGPADGPAGEHVALHLWGELVHPGAPLRARGKRFAEHSGNHLRHGGVGHRHGEGGWVAPRVHPCAHRRVRAEPCVRSAHAAGAHAVLALPARRARGDRRRRGPQAHRAARRQAALRDGAAAVPYAVMALGVPHRARALV